MFFVSKLLKKSPVKLLLTGGLILSDNEEKFYIDSESYITFRKKTVVISRTEIWKVLNDDLRGSNERDKLTEFEKNLIALKTKKILESEGFDVTVSPEFPLEFSINNK